jgi:hypothetical protein
MNERIQSLAEEAEFAYKDLHLQKENFQRFAELLIRECIEVIHQAERTPQGFLYAKGANTLEVEIYKHFGIEP